MQCIEIILTPRCSVGDIILDTVIHSLTIHSIRLIMWIWGPLHWIILWTLVSITRGILPPLPPSSSYPIRHSNLKMWICVDGSHHFLWRNKATSEERIYTNTIYMLVTLISPWITFQDNVVLGNVGSKSHWWRPSFPAMWDKIQKLYQRIQGNKELELLAVSYNGHRYKIKKFVENIYHSWFSISWKVIQISLDPLKHTLSNYEKNRGARGLYTVWNVYLRPLI